MIDHIPTPLATRRLVTKHEELRRKREGTWDPTTMVSQTSPEGAALRAHPARRSNPSAPRQGIKRASRKIGRESSTLRDPSEVDNARCRPRSTR